MSRRDPLVYIEDAISACQALAGFVEGVDEQAYGASRLLRSALERQMTILSEALARLLATAPELTEAWVTDPRQVIAFRNLIVHEYDGVDDAEVLSIAQSDVPVLLGDLQRTVAMLAVAEMQADAVGRGTSVLSPEEIATEVANARAKRRPRA